jgi:hypothetical protein
MDMVKYLHSVVAASALLLASQNSADAQVRTPPSIPAAGDKEMVKVERCKESLSPLYSWQLGDAKRLRDWCRENGYITYKQQLAAER